MVATTEQNEPTGLPDSTWIAQIASAELALVAKARTALKNKLGHSFRLPQLYFGDKRQPLEQELEQDTLNLWAGHMKTDGALIRREDLAYKESDQLGKGATGNVYKARWQSAGGIPVAVKVFNPEAKDQEGLTFREQFENECQMLATLRHKHILALYGQCSYQDQESDSEGLTFMIIMELCRFSVSDALRMDVRRVVMNRVGRHVLDDHAHEYTPMPEEDLLTKRIHHIFAQHSPLPADRQRALIERNIAKRSASRYYDVTRESAAMQPGRVVLPHGAPRGGRPRQVGTGTAAPGVRQRYRSWRAAPPIRCRQPGWPSAIQRSRSTAVAAAAPSCGRDPRLPLTLWLLHPE